MSIPEPLPGGRAMAALVRDIGAVCDSGSVEEVTRRVRRSLVAALASGELDLPPRFRAVLPDRHARRLIHLDPDLGFAVIAITWGPGQRTPLHDHAGTWVVEGVLHGTVEVARYELVGEDDDGRCRFAERERVRGGAGSSGALFPPFEHHVMGNASATEPAVTIHVCGEELVECAVFDPASDGRWSRTVHRLGYDD